MKLFIKILLFVLMVLVANIKIVSATTVFVNIQKATMAAFNKTPSGAFRNVFTGDRVADGATRFSLRNGSLLRQQGWTKGLGGRWTSVGGGNTTSQFPDWVDDLGNVHQGGTYTSQAPNNSIATYYPANGGAYGNWIPKTLPRGMIIDRLGGYEGNYFSPLGTPTYMRALPYKPNQPPRAFKVLKPFQVNESRIAPAFGKSGMGIQFKSDLSAQELIDAGIIRELR